MFHKVQQVLVQDFGDKHCISGVIIIIHAQTFALYFSTTNTKPGSPNQTFNSFSFDSGSYYMGFGAGTGGSTDNHELLSWSLTFT
jgi:hypothetical protein